MQNHPAVAVARRHAGEPDGPLAVASDEPARGCAARFSTTT